MKLGIFTSFDNGHEKYINSAKDLKIEYEIIDILSSDWIKNVEKSDCEGFLCSSTSDFQERKSILDERYFFISQIMKKHIYPSYVELYIHENKRNMAAWLEIENFPHVETKIFLSEGKANLYFDECKYPLVFKANLGAGSSKVRIIKTKFQAKQFAKRVFPYKRWNKGNIGKIYFSKFLGLKIKPDFANAQRFYLIVQEYKRINHEWRIIKIGDSYFGHQKLLKGEFASGSDLVGWVDPPKKLLDLVREVCMRGNFYSMAMDVFETANGEFFINELQSSFGSYNDSQMYINGKPGRYLFVDGDYIFEEGYFNTHGSCMLRVEHFVNLLNKVPNFLY